MLSRYHSFLEKWNQNMQPLSVNEVLKGARKLIEKPENWTQRVLARTPDGRVSEVANPAATQFCARGAVLRFLGVDDEYALTEYDAALYRALPDYAQGMGLAALPGGRVANYNNNSTHKRVLQLFDDAIKATETVPA